ncbi:hypothetical protein AYY22_16015 [Photobacterium kishitanii]|uniref:hypothetical protein n=1 Tax=Photobacterium kishitanii TaxID=318456 RepID=UPI0007EFEC2A|nr:hypothetical protein [Photobacterium kishitanii]OBU27807.1 hypothetical protein AYY22_16015 [Photobacterium kishitanii]
MRFVVNATALRTSGALTILKQFINRASYTKHDYIIFVSNDVKLEQKSKNITLKEVAPKNWFGRIFWDFYAFNKEILSLGVSVDKVISLQNTTVNVNLPQIIYLHQSIPFSNIKFSIKSYCEFKLFLYKKFYMFFIFAFLKDDTKFFVQTNWMKNELCTKTRINEEKVFIANPDILLPQFYCENFVSDSNKKKIYISSDISPL